MDKKRIEIIITGVLIFIFILAWANTIRVLKRKGAAATPSAQTTPASNVLGSVPVPSPLKEGQALQPQESLQWVRDPFSGKVYSSVGGALELNLTGILWDPKKPQALINDKICNIGDTVGGCTVVDIQKDRVILKDEKKEFEIKLE